MKIYVLFPAGVVAHVLADVVAGHGEHHGVGALLQQVHQGAQQLLPALVEPRRVLAPELRRLVHGGPFKPAMEFGHHSPQRSILLMEYVNRLNTITALQKL